MAVFTTNETSDPKSENETEIENPTGGRVMEGGITCKQGWAARRVATGANRKSDTRQKIRLVNWYGIRRDARTVC